MDRNENSPGNTGEHAEAENGQFPIKMHIFGVGDHDAVRASCYAGFIVPPMQGQTEILWSGAVFALLSALLFGASTPFAKLLLGEGIDPQLLAGVLYLGSGFGLAGAILLRRGFGNPSSEASLHPADLLWLLLVIVSGGVAGPLLLMFGLQQTPASTAALLLNLEGLATMLIAWFVFRENVDRRILAGAAAIVAGALVLSWRGGPTPVGWGSLLIAGACLCWGIDNNVTRKLSSADPVQIAVVKGVAAGAVNLAMAIYRGVAVPSETVVAIAGLIGFLGYGVSLVLFVLALRHVGSARTAAYFSTAPIFGAALAILMLGEPVTLQLCLAAVLMFCGVYLHLSEHHEHRHVHEPLDHEHLHFHDAHHRHAHGPNDPPGEPHSHRHKHAPLVHSHPHFPDLHHRHRHR